MDEKMKATLDALFKDCDTDKERQNFLMQTGEMAIMEGYMRITREITTSGMAMEKLDRIHAIVEATSDILEYVNDTLIFNGYASVEGFDFSKKGTN